MAKICLLHQPRIGVYPESSGAKIVPHYSANLRLGVAKAHTGLRPGVRLSLSPGRYVIGIIS